MNESSNGYVIGTSSVIDLRQIYPRSNFASLWKRVEELVAEKRLVCPKIVQIELKKRTDGLAEWVGSLYGMVTEPLGKVYSVVGEITSGNQDWVSENKNLADPWVIAEAECRGWAVVTQEKKPKMIPKVCGDRGVPCMNLLEMIRREGWRF